MVPLEFDNAVPQETMVERHGSKKLRRTPEPSEISVDSDTEAPIVAGNERNPPVPNECRRLEVVPMMEKIRLRTHLGIRFNAVE